MGGKCLGFCSVEGCGKRVLAKKLCSMHYSRLAHGGTVDSARAYRREASCSLDGCDRPHKGHGFCEGHLRRLRRYGDPLGSGSPGRPILGDAPSWAAAHKRVHRVKGRASTHPCVDCGGPAREWSYDGRDPQELVGPAHGFMLAYSLDLDHYEARCSSCHRKYDNAVAKGAQPWGGPDEVTF